MKSKLNLILILVLLSGCVDLEKKIDPRPAKEIVTDFYRDYLDKNPRAASGMNFSKEFKKAQDEYATICNLKNKPENCGLNANRDVYLDAQTIDPNLSYKNSQFFASEVEPGKVDVEFRIYKVPKKLRLVMIHEDGDWVVDDIQYSGKSMRKRLDDEIQYFYLHK